MIDITAARSERAQKYLDKCFAAIPPGRDVIIREDPRPIDLVLAHGRGPYGVLGWEDCGDDVRPVIQTPDGARNIDPAWLLLCT